LKGSFQPTLQNQARPLNDWNPSSAGTFTSEGSLAKMAWGSQAGDIMVKTANKAVDPHANRRAAACMSSMNDSHDGWINHIAWAINNGLAQYLITAGEDGRVKVWNAENAALVWTSRRPDNGAPFVRAVFDQTSRTAVALTETGDVFAWSPIPLQAADANTPIIQPRTLIGRVPSEDLFRRMYNPTTTLLFDYTASKPSVFVHANDDVNMWRFGLDFDKESFEMTRVDNSLGHVTASHLHQPSRASETSTLMVGTSVCQLSMFSLGTDAIQHVIREKDENINCISSNISFTTHEHGAITSIATNNVMLLVGNERGIISIWDMVTLRAVRTIDASELVKNGPGVVKIICRMEQVVASVGRSVVHWKTGMPPTKGRKMLKKGKSMMPRTARYRGKSLYLILRAMTTNSFSKWTITKKP
jgi:WD40 repeat protein